MTIFPPFSYYSWAKGFPLGLVIFSRLPAYHHKPPPYSLVRENLSPMGLHKELTVQFPIQMPLIIGEKLFTPLKNFSLIFSCMLLKTQAFQLWSLDKLTLQFLQNSKDYALATKVVTINRIYTQCGIYNVLKQRELRKLYSYSN